jgi:protein-tyrosine phosphatase
MATVLAWDPTADPAGLVRQVQEALATGSAVVLPGDAGYTLLVDPTGPASAVLPGDVPAAVLAWGPDDPAGLGLDVPAAARRLMTRAWPAPLTIALPVAERLVVPPGWRAVARNRLFAGGLVRFRCPDHPVYEALIPHLPTPALVADLPERTAADAAGRFGDAIGLVVDAGERPAAPPPTVVRADATGWRVVEAGAIPEDELRKLAARLVLFVCTGNTCRSPLAEGLAKRLLADRLGCAADELPARGVWVLSAGVAAYGGGPAAAEAVDVAAEFGVDLAGHRTRPVNPQLLAAADDVIAMTRGHAEALAARYPGVGPPARLLCGDADLDDPIGSGPDVYRACARAIREHLERLLPEWTGS